MRPFPQPRDATPLLSGDLIRAANAAAKDWYWQGHAPKLLLSAGRLVPRLSLYDFFEIPLEGGRTFPKSPLMRLLVSSDAETLVEDAMRKLALVTCLVASLACHAEAKSAAEESWMRCADFEHVSDGSWRTRADTIVRLPGGNPTIHANTTLPGTGTFMGIQFSYLLNQQCGTRR